MNKNPMPYEVPTEMREFAEKSVLQAKKAFDGFMGAASKAVETVEGQATTVQSSANDMTRKAMSYAEQNVAAAFELAEKLVRAKDLNDMMAIQTEFARVQMASFQTQVKEFGAAMESRVKSAGEVAQKAADDVRTAAMKR